MSRLDVYLTEHHYFDSRQKAQDAIRQGLVWVNGQQANKPSLTVASTHLVELRQAPSPYVGRGAYKLLRAVEVFGLSMTGQRVADVGASTGGFTQVALQAGAQRVYAIDVGSGQLHPSLCDHPQVCSLEQLHIRDTRLTHLDGQAVDWIVADLSFISLRQVLDAFVGLLAPHGQVVVLIKPQFELQEKKYFKNGIVRQASYHRQAVEGVREQALALGLHLNQLTWAPLTEWNKNIEFLAHFVRHSCPTVAIDPVVAHAHAEHHSLKPKR